jgi:hypothetical protein
MQQADLPAFKCISAEIQEIQTSQQCVHVKFTFTEWHTRVAYVTFTARCLCRPVAENHDAL